LQGTIVCGLNDWVPEIKKARSAAGFLFVAFETVAVYQVFK